MNIIIIQKEETKEWIREYFPNFDFSKPLTRREWKNLRMAIRKIEAEKTAASDFANLINCQKIISERKIEVGSRVVDIKNPEGIEEVSSISINYHLVFKGKKGLFHPVSWKLSEE